MKTRGVFPVLWVLLAPLALTSACSSVAVRSAGSGPVLRGSLGEGRVRSIRMQLSQAQSRIRELETALKVQSEQGGGIVAALKERERELTTELSETKQVASTLKSELVQAETALATSRTELATAQSSLTEARAATEAALAAAGTEAAEKIATLKVELDGERNRRVDIEDQLTKLREETSAGPFDTASATALQEAQGEIERLKTQLSGEKKERDDLEKRFAELTLKLEQQPEPDADAGPDAEMAALQADQTRLMAAIEQDLAASRQREETLRTTIAAMQASENSAPSPASGKLVVQVKDLESENQALQASLDAEHDRNVELAAKLEVATRVADLIFKMRREGRVPNAAAVEEAAGQ